MNYLNGGYVMLKHNATQTELANAYKTKKPILLYDENGFAYWARINETTSIVDDETIYTYDVVKINQIESLIDSAGNLRFIEGDGELNTISGLTITYNKYSLSGSHLMFVIAGSVTNASVLTGKIVTYNLPEWILDKIYATYGSFIERKALLLYANDNSSQNIELGFIKASTNVYIQFNGSLTLTADRAFRIQFDLLIDNDYSE